MFNYAPRIERPRAVVRASNTMCDTYLCMHFLSKHAHLSNPYIPNFRTLHIVASSEKRYDSIGLVQPKVGFFLRSDDEN